jgi:hypothetical protein
MQGQTFDFVLPGLNDHPERKPMGDLLRFQISDFRLQISDFRSQILDFRSQILDFRFQISTCFLVVVCWLTGPRHKFGGALKRRGFSRAAWNSLKKRL